jgi:hypothetical protein
MQRTGIQTRQPPNRPSWLVTQDGAQHEAMREAPEGDQPRNLRDGQQDQQASFAPSCRGCRRLLLRRTSLDSAAVTNGRRPQPQFVERPYRWSQRWFDDPPVGTIVYGNGRVIYMGNGDWEPIG